jgi:predicted DNA-binding transcriptional regulator AlpA
VKSATDPIPTIPSIVTMDDLTGWLQCTRRTIERYIALGKFPQPFRMGGLRWRRATIEACRQA